MPTVKPLAHGGVPSTVGREWPMPGATTHEPRTRVLNVSEPSISTWVAQAAGDKHEPTRREDVHSGAEHEQLVCLPRRYRHPKLTLGILATIVAGDAQSVECSGVATVQ